ncbi:MAG: hypothetical protein NC388_07480 [Clostridium sp.]|nr:hypothetical protein [Clostridium sp.]
MEQHLNLANLLSFVQIAVVFNFSLFFLRGKNTFKEVCDEFNLYLGALAKYSLKDSIKEIRRVRRTMPEDIRRQKEKAHKYYRLLDNLIKNKEQDFFILPCIGLFSGTYSLIFLLSGGLYDWDFDCFITDILLVLAQVVLVMNIISWLQLRNNKEEDTVRYIIMSNVIWFILICIFSVLFTAFGWVYPFFTHIDYAVLSLAVLTVYFPALLLVLNSLKKIILLLRYQYACNRSTSKLKGMLDKRKAH